MIRGLIFDFDGLIIDTETQDFLTWQEYCQELGCALPLATWAPSVGSAGATNPLDPYDYLEGQLGRPIDRAAVRAERRRRYLARVALQPVLPGVESYLIDARRLGLRVGLASSSSHEWVEGHLVRLGLRQHFESVSCSDDVVLAKPEPELYLHALRALGLQPDEAIALEDSPNGALAAKRAGIYCVAVPNPLTRELPLDHADLVLGSLAEMPLEQLVKFFQKNPRGTL